MATIRVGEPLESVKRAQSEVAQTFLIIGAVTLAAALLAGYLVAARTAAPLRRMARIAAMVDAGDLAHRIGTEGLHDEVRLLAESFDHMLERLEDAFSRQREFVSDASHELRTPLTAIRGQLEVLAREPNPSLERVREVEQIAVREIARMERLVGDLLTWRGWTRDWSLPLPRFGRALSLLSWPRRLGRRTAGWSSGAHRRERWISIQTAWRRWCATCCETRSSTPPALAPCASAQR